MTTPTDKRRDHTDYTRGLGVSHKASKTKAHAQDTCYSPPYIVDALTGLLENGMTIWESAVGEGHLSDALSDYYPQSEIIATGLPDFNYFYNEPVGYDVQVTNCPFSLKFEWIDRALKLRKPFAILVPAKIITTASCREYLKYNGCTLMILNPRVNFYTPTKGWHGQAQFESAWITKGLGMKDRVDWYDITEAKAQFEYSMGI